MGGRARARPVLLGGALVVVLFAGCSSRTVVVLEDAPAVGPELGLDARVDLPRQDLSAADLPRPDLPKTDLPSLPDAWVISAGGAGSHIMGQNVATDSAGNAYVTGVFAGTVTFGATVLKSKGQELFVAKVSPSGKFLWALSSDADGGPCYWANIAVDSQDNVYVAGSWGINSSATIVIGSKVLPHKANHTYHLVAKVSPAGVVSWVTQVEIAHQYARCAASLGVFDHLYFTHGVAIAVGGVGTIYIASCFIDTATFGSTVLTTAKDGSGPWGYYENVYVARLSPSGSFLWAISSGSANHDGAYGIAVDGAGNAVVAGGYWYDGPTTLGTVVLKPKDPGNLFLARVSAGGTFLSATSPGSAPNGIGGPLGFGLDSAGNTYLTGSLGNKATFGLILQAEKNYVVKVSSAGTPLWGISAGYQGLFSDVAINSVGTAYTTGQLWSIDSNPVTIGKTTLTPSAGSFSDVAVVKVNPAGTVQAVFSTTHSSDSWARGLGVALDSSDNTYVVGHYGGTVTFGSTTLTSKTNQSGNENGDLFIWRIPAAKGSDAGP